ncbi:MAG: beta-propeller domain-containing protein, partial [Acidimicrobiia bacterium]|nr:beta-propeller domain-containing protein [Acidimicrobiia bacterium]
HLRVASTTTPNWWGWGGSSDSQSQVTVFEVTGGDLEQVGFVDGLGKTEQIYSVRFMGDTAYVVTFRQTDPLYVLDLSDVTDPTVTGELKIPGYSAYLHPAGEGRLLGVGQAGDEDGRTQGTQVSLFDVSDPNDPKLLDAVMIENAWSAVEGDHLAFTMTEGVAYVPFEAWTWDETNNGEGTETFDIGVMAVTVGTDSLDLTSILRPVADGPIDWNDKIFEEKGIAPDPWRMSARRTIRIDDRVYLITNGGIAIFELDGFERVGYTEFK